MSATQLDLRGVPPLNRHPMLAAAFQRLPAGGARELIADRDPQPLQTKVHPEPKRQFRWQVLEQHGATWRVRVPKAGAQDCCGRCTCN